MVPLSNFLASILYITSKGPHEPGFFSMKHALEYCYSPLDGMLVHGWVYAQQYDAGTYLYTFVKRDKVE